MSDLSVKIMAAPGDPAAAVMTVTGPMTVQYAAELRDRLLEVVAGGRGVTVDLSGVTDIDVAGFQLLCAASRTAGTSKNGFVISCDQGAVVRETAEVAGLLRETRCNEDLCSSCIWMGGRN